jgi:hypothetical protein
VKDIFLCHTGADKEWVEGLAARLEAESIGDRKISVWFDKWDIEGGGNILSKIEEGLKQSRYVAVVLSPAMTKADWPTLEWQTQVFDDPAGKRGRILPVLRHVFDPITLEPIEIPLPLKILKRYDFSLERRFEDEFQSLVRQLRGEAPLRGRQPSGRDEPQTALGPEQPDDVADSLVSNLLPTTHLPPFVFSDESTETDPAIIIEKVHPRVPWLLSGGRLFSFCDPATPRNPFAGVLTKRFQRKERTADWLASDDRASSAVRLLNDALRSLCRSLHIWSMPGTKEQFFFAIPNGRPRSFRWGASGRTRTLAKMVASATGEAFGVHHACRIRFINLGGTAFLLLQPGWTFTSDGSNPLPGRQLGMLSMRWGGRERNAAVLRNTLMWGLVLSSGNSEMVMHVGSSELRVAAVPAHSGLNVGISADSIRLARILGGEGAGETGPVGAAATDELDGIAILRDIESDESRGDVEDSQDGEEDVSPS